MLTNNRKDHSFLRIIEDGKEKRSIYCLLSVLVAAILIVSLNLSGCSLGSYTVRFYDDVFMSESGLLSTQKVARGDDAKPPRVPKREGKRFVKWNEAYTNVQHDLDIYAQWTKDDDSAVDSSAETGGEKVQDEEWADEPNYTYLDYTYRELTVDDIDGLSSEGRTSWGGTTGRYWARDVRASCYVDRILRADDYGTIALYVKANVVDESKSRGFDTKYFAVCGSENMFDEVNLGSNITFYGSSGIIGNYSHLNTRWLIFEADYVRVDSRDLEQYVKPNNIDPRK